MRRKLIVGNWKMQGALAQNQELLNSFFTERGLLSVDLAVLVPAPYLAQAQGQLQGTGWFWGAQDVSDEVRGAFTGEVAASMLLDFGSKFTTVGHSERRQRHGESDQVVARKAQRALDVGITPIVCLGESLSERERGETRSVVRRQLAAIVDLLGASAMAQTVLAYEPVWAIGTGRSATAEQAQEVHAWLRGQMGEHDDEVAGKLRILYGGSVKPSNAVELMALPDVDGALVGGASLVASEFLAIAHAAARVN